MEKNEDLEVVSQKADSKLETQVKDTEETVSHDKIFDVNFSGFKHIFNFSTILVLDDVKNCLNNTKTSEKKILVILITFFHHFLAMFIILDIYSTIRKF